MGAAAYFRRWDNGATGGAPRSSDQRVSQAHFRAICSSTPRAISTAKSFSIESRGAAPAGATGSSTLKLLRQRLLLSPCAPVQWEITLRCDLPGRTWEQVLPAIGSFRV